MVCSSRYTADVGPATSRPEQDVRESDWKNDEPTMTAKNADRAYGKRTKTCGADL
jgi:hypothetical protein